MHVKLADIADIRTGYSFRGKIDHDPKGNIAVIQMRDIRDIGQLDLADCIRIQEEPAHRRHLLHAGDVLLQARGGKFPAGIVDERIKGIAAFGLHVLHPSDKVLPDYLAWVLNQPHTHSAMLGMAQGTRVPLLSKSNLANLLIPLPPMEQQGQIANVARLQREASCLATELKTLQDQYAAATTWRAANKD